MRVYLLVEQLEAGDWRNHTILEDQNGLDDPRKAAAALQMPYIGLDGTDVKRILSGPAMTEGLPDSLVVTHQHLPS